MKQAAITFLIFLAVSILFPFQSHASPPIGCASVATSGPQKGGCATVNTAIGAIHTDIPTLIRDIFRILLSFSGVVAVVLIISSGYQLVASQGNPEKVKEARERLTSAIVGLIFIIFSITILQIIGVDLLNLPGFSN